MGGYKSLIVLILLVMLCGIVNATTIADNWSRVTDSAPIQFRWASDATVLNNVIYMYGGDWYEGNGVSAESWAFDGTTFTLKNASVAIGARHGSQMATFKNSLVVIGGFDGTSTFYDDVWNSTDGITFTKQNTTIGGSGTYRPLILTDNISIWKIGGGTTSQRHVYNSTNLINWTLINATPAFSVRYGAGGIYNPNDQCLYIMGGSNDTSNLNDIWKAPANNSGIWTQVTAAAAWPARYAFKPVIADGKCWVIGGYNGITGIPYYNDIWYADLNDMVNWTQVTPASPYFFPRAEGSVVNLSGTIYVIGGCGEGNPSTINGSPRYIYSTNDVWKTVTSTPTWLTGWNYRQSVVINSTKFAYEVAIPIKTINGTGTSTGDTIYLQNHANANLSDVRFTDSAMNSLDYWHYPINTTAEQYWVELASTPTSQTVYCYYGNATVADATSGQNTFSFFDSFSGTSLNTTYAAGKWNQWLKVTDTVGVTGGIITISGGGQIKTSASYLFPQNTTMAANASYDANNKYWDLGYVVVPNYAIYDVNWYIPGKLSAYQQNSGGSAQSDLGTSFANAYHIYNIERNASVSNNFWIDSGSVTTLSTRPAANNLPVYNYAESTGKMDWFTVRNSINPMPSYNTWGAEENQTTVVTPVANFTANTTFIVIPGRVLLTDTSTNTPTMWNWSMGDGSSNITTQNVTYQYVKRGFWSVVQYVCNSGGCSGNTTQVKVY